MNSQRRGAQLYGFFNPTAQIPSFIVPLFRYMPGGNESLVQELDRYGAIIKFSSIDVDNIQIHETPDKTVVAVGDNALWGFIFPNGDHIISVQENLSNILGVRRSDTYDFPFTDLQVLKFRKEKEAVAIAARRAYGILKNISSTTAEAWLDEAFLLPISREFILKSEKNSRKRHELVADLQDIIIDRSNKELIVYVPEKIRENVTRRGIELALLYRIESVLRDFRLPRLSIRVSVERDFLFGKQNKLSKPRRQNKRDEGVQSIELDIGALIKEGNFTGAENEIMKALNKAKQLPNLPLQVFLLRQIAEVYMAQGRIMDAMQALQIAKEISDGINNEIESTWISLDIVGIRIEMGELDAAEFDLSSIVVPKFQENAELSGVAKANKAWAEIFILRKDYKSALNRLIEVALPAFIKEKDTEGELLARGKIAEVLIILNKVDEVDGILGSGRE